MQAHCAVSRTNLDASTAHGLGKRGEILRDLGSAASHLCFYLRPDATMFRCVPVRRMLGSAFGSMFSMMMVMIG